MFDDDEDNDVKPKDMGFDGDIEIDDVGYRFTSDPKAGRSSDDPGVKVWICTGVDEDGDDHQIEWLREDNDERDPKEIRLNDDVYNTARIDV